MPATASGFRRARTGPAGKRAHRIFSLNRLGTGRLAARGPWCRGEAAGGVGRRTSAAVDGCRRSVDGSTRGGAPAHTTPTSSASGDGRLPLRGKQRHRQGPPPPCRSCWTGTSPPRRMEPDADPASAWSTQRTPTPSRGRVGGLPTGYSCRSSRQSILKKVEPLEHVFRWNGMLFHLTVLLLRRQNEFTEATVVGPGVGDYPPHSGSPLPCWWQVFGCDRRTHAFKSVSKTIELVKAAHLSLSTFVAGDFLFDSIESPRDILSLGRPLCPRSFARQGGSATAGYGRTGSSLL